MLPYFFDINSIDSSNIWCSDFTVEILKIVSESGRNPSSYMIKNKDSNTIYTLPSRNKVYLIVKETSPLAGTEKVILKATAEGGATFQMSVQIEYTKDCGNEFVDPQVIPITQQNKLVLTVEDLKFAKDLLNCPVEGLVLIEEQPTESIDESVSPRQFDEELKLFKVENKQITVNPQLFTE